MSGGSTRRPNRSSASPGTCRAITSTYTAISPAATASRNRYKSMTWIPRIRRRSSRDHRGQHREQIMARDADYRVRTFEPRPVERSMGALPPGPQPAGTSFLFLRPARTSTEPARKTYGMSPSRYPHARSPARHSRAKELRRVPRLGQVDFGVEPVLGLEHAFHERIEEIQSVEPTPSSAQRVSGSELHIW